MPPKLCAIRRDDTHRLIPSRHSDRSVLERLTTRADDLPDLFELEGATNDRLLGEANLLPGISVHELLFGVAFAHIVFQPAPCRNDLIVRGQLPSERRPMPFAAN